MFILNKTNASINDFILGSSISIDKNKTVKVLDAIGKELLKKYGFLQEVKKVKKEKKVKKRKAKKVKEEIKVEKTEEKSVEKKGEEKK